MDDENLPKIADKAEELFALHYNCCESVAIAVAEHYGKPREAMLQISTPFGGGIGGGRDVCGAFIGGAIAIGRILGRTSGEDVDRKWAVGKVASQYRDRFLGKMGTTNCGLIRGDRPLDSLHDTVCGDAVRTAVIEAIKAIEEGKAAGL
ncbi:MAG: C-GCAxxG-C-C family protein [Candidatus Ranarchaeia archaeon]